jgi:7-cyano-7-deazaguanine synthase
VTAAHLVKNSYDELMILFFNYNQRNLKAEREASKLAAENLKVKFKELNLKFLGEISTSQINSKSNHKKISSKELKNTKKEIEKWYVPCRNLLFVSHALAFAESHSIKNKSKVDIILGLKQEGPESYPDTTKKFVSQLNSLSQKTTKTSPKIIAPLINKDKEDIVLIAKKLNIKLEKTFSCYTSEKIHCGTCLSCKLRQSGFYWANIKDPTVYKLPSEKSK